MSNIQIEVVENGFLVYEGAAVAGMVGRKWAFETPEALAAHVHKWGQDTHTDKEMVTESRGEQQ